MTENCYIHIPFCKRKCSYCAFVSFPCLERITGYTYSLLKEISEKYSGEPLSTLYIGGGTPSLMPTDLLSKIIKKFSFGNSVEITIEINPDDVSTELIKKYIDLGINRISMGVQSLDDNILEISGRRHDSKTALSAIQAILDSGFENLSIDLIYGLPGQSKKSFASDIKAVLGFDVKHISLYGLKIEENTPFDKLPLSNFPSEDVQAEMYTFATEYLPNHGFSQYEISNFAKLGFESRHNLNYWNNNSYYGFGVAAHGYVDGFRYYNTSDLNEYMEHPAISEYAHHVTVKELEEEEIFLGLRKAAGLNIGNFNEKFGVDFLEKYNSVIKKFGDEFFEIKDGYLRFTTRGFLLSNIILSEFLL